MLRSLVGSEEMQYYRGSVVTVLMVMLGVSFVLLLLLFALRCAHGTFAIAINKLRLPSSPLVTVLLTCEMGISTGVSMILNEGSGLVDITLAVILIVPLLAYMVVYVMRSMSKEHITVEPTGGIDEYERELREENANNAKKKAEADGSEDDEDIRLQATASSSSPSKKPSRSLMRRLMWYALEPTHDVVIRKSVVTSSELRLDSDSEMDTDTDKEDEVTTTDTPPVSNNDVFEEGDSDKKKEVPPEDMSEGERWLRHNYYFVSEKRWATFGAIEVVGGTIANILEGIPLTTTSVWMCIARPACILAIMLVTFALLLWKVPMAVRVQQWCAVVVIGGMLLASIIVTWNSVAPSEDLELAAGYVASFVMGASMILSFVEIVVMVMTHVPSVRALLSLPMHTLDSVIKHSVVVHKREEEEANICLLGLQDDRSDSDPEEQGGGLAAPLIAEEGLLHPQTPLVRLKRRVPLTAFTYADPLGTPPPTDEDEDELEHEEKQEVKRVVDRVDEVEKWKRELWEAGAKARQEFL
eukprot:TRINITY_DN12248_c0_g2_i10.p1 TRINITY_DN12248_c0_g2~~TRINITY_DN12248_c0_g2_i10.p1  ORF type:complete len:526 (+),score=97.04 TRINITY_DN12248_c0_g2_i10:111-1688(+)